MSLQKRTVQKEELERCLTTSDRHRIFKVLGFRLNGRESDAKGRISGVLGPPELGEGTHGNFSINLATGWGKDFGSSAWEGSLYDAVMAVEGLAYPEALEWVAEQIGYAPAKNGSAKNAQPASGPLTGRPLKEGPLTIERLARAKGLAPEELRGFGVRELQPGTLRITYRDRAGDAFSVRQRLRTALRATDGSAWTKGSAPIVSYGLWRLEVMQAQGSYCLLVEGASDAWTAWTRGMPALGIPGSSMHRALEREHVHGFEQLYVAIEADEGGRTFARNMHSRLEAIGYEGAVYALAFSEDAPDLNDLYRDDPAGFSERVRRMRDEAPRLGEWLDENGCSTGMATDPAKGQQSGGQQGGRGASTQSERLLRLAGDIDLCHSPDGTAYATFEVGGMTRTATIGSSLVADLLRRRFYEAEGRPPSAQALQDAKDVLRARARFDGPKLEVHVRVAGHEGHIYIDLCNDGGEVVKITPGGWSVIDMGDAPVRFRRTAAMKSLPRPRRGGSVGLLRWHVPVQDNEGFALLCGYLVQALRPTGPYPPLELTGEQGAGKTTTERMIRALIDPSHVPIRACPRNVRDLVVAADNNWALAYDNLSGLQSWLSDAFCRLSTGGGFGTRRLYSNREEELFYALRPVILNGIDDITTRGDLADRAITLHLSAIPEDERRTESDVWAAFEADRPLILGALYDALSTALRRIDEVDLDELPRMADFAEWVVAAEPSLPVDEDAFMVAYTRNRAHAREDAVAGDMVASAIVDMLSDDDREHPGRWTGSMSELLEDLRAYLPNPEKPPRGYPDTHQAMTAKLRRIMPALRSLGVTKEDLPRTSSRRAFALQMDYPGTTASPVSSVSQSGPTGNKASTRSDAGFSDARPAASSHVMRNQDSARSEEDDDAGDTHDAGLSPQSVMGRTTQNPSEAIRPSDAKSKPDASQSSEAPF